MSLARDDGVDIFLSYTHADNERAATLYRALTAAGLNVWIDRERLNDGDRLTENLRRAIDSSTLMVSLASDQYVASDVCRWELLRMLVRGVHEQVHRVRFVGLDGSPSRRLGALRHLEQSPRWRTDTDVAGIVARIKDDVLEERRLRRSAGSAAEPSVDDARSSGMADGASSNFGEGRMKDFVGRIDVLVSLAAEAAGEADVAHVQTSEHRVVSLSGMPGLGKTMVAKKFALDFEPAFPGGVFWFDVRGDAINSRVRTDEQRQDILAAFLEQLESRLRYAPEKFRRMYRAEPRSPDVRAQLRHARSVIAGSLAASKGRVLWVVDDVPQGLGADIALLLCPYRAEAMTLLTAQQRLGAEGYAQVHLSPLSESEGVRLLGRDPKPVEPEDPHELERLKAIFHLVGGHPLALAVARHSIQLLGSLEVLDDLTKPSAENIGLIARDFESSLPTGHSTHIVRTFQKAMSALVSSSSSGSSNDALLRLLAFTPFEREVPLALVKHALGSAGLDPASAIDALYGRSLLDPPRTARRGDSDETVYAVHALVRKVARALWSTDSAPLEKDAKRDSTIAESAATWMRDEGRRLRNTDDYAASRLYQDSLVPLEVISQERTAQWYVDRCDTLRGIARGDMRNHVSAAPSESEVDAPYRDALDTVQHALDLCAEGLAAHGADPDLVRAHAQAQALRGDLLSRVAQRWGSLSTPRSVATALNIMDEAIALLRVQRSTREQLHRELVARSGPGARPELIHAATELSALDVMRSRFNLPGRLVDQAKLLVQSARLDDVEPEDVLMKADRALAEARELYASLEAGRRELHAALYAAAAGLRAQPEDGSLAAECHANSSPLLEIAAGAHGLAVESYVRANLRSTSADVTRAGLLVAADHCARALFLRMAARHERDMSKSAALALKIGLAMRLVERETSPIGFGAYELTAAELTGFADAVALKVPPQIDGAAEPTVLVDAARHSPDADNSPDRRDRSVSAVLLALEALPAGQRDTLATTGDVLARAALTYLTILPRYGIDPSVTADMVRNDWSDDHREWVRTIPYDGERS